MRPANCGADVYPLLALAPAFPFAGFLWLATLGARASRKAAAIVGVGSVAASTVVAALLAFAFFTAPPPGGAYTQTLWSWIAAGGFSVRVSFYLDALSLVMLLVVSFVSFLIHLYSAEFMREDDGYSRFFAYMNLFVASMLTLSLANNLLLLFLGWEGVGLCSYLLIGFWYRDRANGRAARKAFIVTRVGDTAFTLGLLLLFNRFGTLNLPRLMHLAARQWPVGSAPAIAAAALLLGGAVGKSAQLPLQTWLPDAMAGPTPTSALIHAATMVTAGVYLIARTHVLFALAPPVRLAVAVIGAATLLLAGCSALTQYDLKRVLAYSTISQIGYMFLALGVGAWSAAIFHLMTHAFFKALLFLVAGIVIQALHEEHDIRKMGGLRRDLPYAFWGFVIGGCALAGLPLVTAGFYSKDLILWRAWSSPSGGPALWVAGMLGVLLTALYIFRLIFLVFYGEQKTAPGHWPAWRIKLPVLTLSVLALIGGFVNLPPWMGKAAFFTNFLHAALPPAAQTRGGLTEPLSELIAACLFALGLFLAWWLYALRRVPRPASGFVDAIRRFWFADWGMDWLYDAVFVRPLVAFARLDRHDVIDAGYAAVARVHVWGWRILRRSENGRLRWYAAWITAGAVILAALAVWA